MKAIICERYGPPEVLKLAEVDKPIPGEHDVLIKIHAASATAADGMMRRGVPFYGRLFIGLTKPKYAIQGTGFAGEIAAVGEAVAQFKVGDQVFGEIGLGPGTYAEYVCLPESGVITTMPANISFAEAAPVCDGAITGLNFLRDVARLQQGQRVLINGASGSLGTAAVQLAKVLGAEVTGVCSAANTELVRALGADHLIDYTTEDFTKTGQTYDVIYDTVGKSSFPRCKGSLTANGSYLSPVLGLPLLFQMLWTTKFSRQQAKFSATGLRPADELRDLLYELKDMLAQGTVRTVVDRTYPLEEIIEAHRYVEGGHKKGNVVLTI